MDKIQWQDSLMGLVRHALTGAGSVLVAQGYATQDTVMTISAGVMALIGLAWSIWEKHA
jgi:hypothetical protein